MGFAAMVEPMTQFLVQALRADNGFEPTSEDLTKTSSVAYNEKNIRH